MIRSSTAPATVFVDADNTLWDTDGVFANAQRNMLKRIEAATGTAADADDRLVYVRAVDQAIAERHHARLRYPPKLLIWGLEAALAGLPAERAARAAWRGNSMPDRLPDGRVGEIEQAFLIDLSRVPEIRPGVLEGLETLRTAHCLVVIVTEGALEKVEKTAKRVGLDGLVARIVEGPKRPELFRRMLRLIRAPKRAFMIGDQLDRDVAPAKAAGLETIYFPSGFRPRWTVDEAEAKPDHVIATFADVPCIVLAGAQERRHGSVVAG